jgi:hypothetical protein
MMRRRATRNTPRPRPPLLETRDLEREHEADHGSHGARATKLEPTRCQRCPAYRWAPLGPAADIDEQRPHDLSRSSDVAARPSSLHVSNPAERRFTTPPSQLSRQSPTDPTSPTSARPRPATPTRRRPAARPHPHDVGPRSELIRRDIDLVSLDGGHDARRDALGRQSFRKRRAHTGQRPVRQSGFGVGWSGVADPNVQTSQLAHQRPVGARQVGRTRRAPRQ